MPKEKVPLRYEVDKKEKFINLEYTKNYNSNVKSLARSALRIIDDIEVEYKKPFYDIDKHIIINALKNIKSDTAVPTYFTYLNRYANFIGADEKYFSNIIKPKEIEEYVKERNSINKLCGNFNELNNVLKEINKFEREKAVVCLLYEGLTSDDIMELKIEDISEDIIYSKDRIFYGINNITKKYINESLNSDIEKFGSNHYDKQFFFKRDNTAKRNGKFTEERKSARIKATVEIFKGYLKENNIAFCENPTEISDSGFFNYLNCLDLNNLNEDEFRNIYDVFYGASNTRKKKSKREILDDLNLFNECNHNVNKRLNYKKRIVFKEFDKKLRDTVKNEYGRNLIKRGELGEYLVLMLLCDKYGKNTVKKKEDTAGYDFHLKTTEIEKFIEVKTLQSVTSSFFISINEIETAAHLGQNYYLVLAIIEPQKEYLQQIIVIRNPAEKLRLTDNNIIRLEEFDMKNFTIKTRSYEIKITNIDKIDYVSEI